MVNAIDLLLKHPRSSTDSFSGGTKRTFGSAPLAPSGGSRSDTADKSTFMCLNTDHNHVIYPIIDKVGEELLSLVSKQSKFSEESRKVSVENCVLALIKDIPSLNK